MSEGKKEILLGDCLELMKDIPNGSIDMILADLPYGTTACKWDTIIPFEPLWEQYNRIIKDNGAIVLTASQPFTSALVMSNIKMFKYEWIWHKSIPSGAMSAKYQPMKAHENILVFAKNKTKFFPIKEVRSENTHLITEKKRQYKSKSEHNNFMARIGEQEEKRYPTTVRLFGNVSRWDSLHPTQKPVSLFEYLIKTYTNEWDLVLDNTAGSGTTAIACLNTNRQFIVMEKEQKYYDIILKRVGDFNKKFETQTLFGNEM